MAAAILPAMLFFVAVWFGVDGFANRYDLKGMGDEARVPVKTLVVTGLFFMVPFAVLMERLFIGGQPRNMLRRWPFSPLLSCCFSTLPASRPCGRSAAFFVGHHHAGQQIAMIAAIILCASIIVGVLGQTGLGVKITSLIIDLSGGWLWLPCC
jgi:TRAP-type uncharacterized transport system fused permease subunit